VNIRRNARNETTDPVIATDLCGAPNRRHSADVSPIAIYLTITAVS
jgi:hypothetical protein